MPVAQIIRFDERLVMSRPRCALPSPMACVIVQLHRPPARRAAAAVGPMVIADEDRKAGRGRDPG